MSVNAPPNLRGLTAFPTRHGKVNIPLEVGVKYQTFAAQLLEDPTVASNPGAEEGEKSLQRLGCAAMTRAEGISEVSIRRDSVYALVLVSHCVIPFVFDDVKLARDDSVVIVVSSLMALMTDQVPNVRVKATIMSSWFRCESLFTLG